MFQGFYYAFKEGLIAETYYPYVGNSKHDVRIIIKKVRL